MSESSQKFIEKALRQAGIKRSHNTILDYAMQTISVIMDANYRLHKENEELKRKRSRDRKP